jgi:tetratricopeptide (TPR) repeat protein
MNWRKFKLVFNRCFNWYSIITCMFVLALTTIGLIVTEYQSLYRIEQLISLSLQIEGHTPPYDPWRDVYQLTNGDARSVAQQALSAAQRQVAITPAKPELDRLMGRAAILAGQPTDAIAAYSRAVRQRPASSLLWFELGMAYEQLILSETIAVLSDVQPETISWEWIKPPLAMQEGAFPLASTETPDWWTPAGPIRRTVFVGDQIVFRITLPTDPVILSFWVSDHRDKTTTYNVILNNELIGTFTFPVSATAQSWHHGHVDVSPWAGQAVTITLLTDSPQAGWGELRLIDRTAIACIQVDCLQRATAAWAQGGFTATDFLQTGMVAFRQKQYAEALRWFTRATISGADVASTIWYTRYLMTNESDDLIQSVTFDRGWNSSEMRLRAWVRWASILHDAQRFAEVERGLRHVLDTTAQDDRSVDWLLSEVYRRLGVALWVQDRPGEALPFAMKAVELNDRSVWAHIHYGKILYFSDPGQVHQTEQAFAKALALDSRPQIWLNLIGFWKWVKESERAIALCRQAQRQGLSEEIQSECK